jgi:hypothetical protein
MKRPKDETEHKERVTQKETEISVDNAECLRLWKERGLKRYNGVKIERGLKKWTHKRAEWKKEGENATYF